MKIKGAIFDLDGTLLDSMGIWAAVGEQYLKSRSIEPPDNINEIVYGMTLEDAALYMQKEFGITDSSEVIIGEFISLVKHFYFEEVEIRPGVREFLEVLKHNGVKMCIATAADITLAEAALKRNCIYEYFGRIFTCSETGSGKDKPDIFNSALEYLGTNKEYTWVFEDSTHAAVTAKKAGFPVCGVYDKYADKKIKDIVDIYILSFKDGGVI